MIATIAEKEKRLLDENNGHTITDEEFLARQASNNAIPTLSKQIAEISETFRPNMTDAKYMEMISLEYDKIRQYQNILNTLFDQNGLDVLQIDPTNILNTDTTQVLQSSETSSSAPPQKILA